MQISKTYPQKKEGESPLWLSPQRRQVEQVGGNSEGVEGKSYQLTFLTLAQTSLKS